MHTLKKKYTTPLLLFFLPFRNICCPPPLYPEKWLRGCHFVPLLALSVVDYSFKRGGTHKSLVIFSMKTNPPFSSFPKTFETVSTCLNRNNPSRWDQVEMDRLVDKFSSSSSSPCVCLWVRCTGRHVPLVKERLQPVVAASSSISYTRKRERRGYIGNRCRDAFQCVSREKKRVVVGWGEERNWGPHIQLTRSALAPFTNHQRWK